MKKLLITIIMFLVLLISVKADLNDGLQHVYLFDDNSFADETGNLTAVNDGTVNDASGILGEARDFDHTADLVKFNDDDWLTQHNRWTLIYWMKPDDGADMVAFEERGTADRILSRPNMNQGSDPHNMYITDGVATTNQNAGNLNAGSWNMITLQYDDNTERFTVYVGNNSHLNVSQNLDSATGSNSYSAFGYTSYLGSIDHVFVWDRILSQYEIDEMYGGGTSRSYPFNVSEVTLQLNTDLVNNTENYNQVTLNFNYNGTFTNNNLDIVNISFYQNEIFNRTILNVNLSLNNQYNITFPDQYTGWYNISFNASNSEVNDSIGYYYYNVDLLQPLIRSDFVNNSLQTLNENLEFYVNFTDDNLYAYNITRYNKSNDEILEQYFVDSLTTTYEENRTVRNETSEGNFSFMIEVWDSHTSKKIKTKNQRQISNGVEFDRKVKIYSDDSAIVIAHKQVDRYTLDFNFNQKNKNKREFYVESDGILKYIKNSKYEGHLVDFKNRLWIDFEADELQGKVKVEKVTDYKYKITVQSSKKDSINFKSIGDLNFNTREYLYSVSSCQSNFTNTSYTGWVNQTSCNSSNIYIQNRTYIRTDLNGCIANVSHNEQQTLSCNYCYDNLNTEDCAYYVDYLTYGRYNTLVGYLESINIMPILILYCLFFILGFNVIKQGSNVSGMLLISMTYFFDFFLVAWFYEKYIDVLQTGNFITDFKYILALFLIIWIIIKGLFILNLRFRKRNI